MIHGVQRVERFAALLFVTTVFGFGSKPVFAQQSADTPLPPAQQAPAGPQSGGCCILGVFTGLTDRDDIDFTSGLELEYSLSSPWSVGGILEHTPNGLRGENVTLLLGTVHYRPVIMPSLKLTGGAGIEFNDFGDDIRLRAGIGYDLIQGDRFTITPRLAVDIEGGDSENIVLGATLLYRF